MESEVCTISDAIAQLNKDSYYEKDFKHFVEVEGELYPAKTLYSLIHNVHHKECHTSDAEKYFQNIGYQLVNKDPLSTLPTIWKVSHGDSEISDVHSFWLDEHNYITVHQETLKSQGKNFITEVHAGDIVSLYRSGYVKALVRVVSDIILDNDSPLGNEWSLRKYEAIHILPELKKYIGVKRGWSPSYNNTLGKVKKQKSELSLFEENILQPYYAMTLDDLFERTGLSNQGDSMEKNMSSSCFTSPLNQILYGPPGTGKTYHTIEAAVKAAEPDEYAELGIDSELGVTEDQRLKLIEKYKSLSDVGRIRFVTFHQSYGYEEFVEGLKAKTTDNNEIEYVVENGIFKTICEDANDNKSSSSYIKTGDQFGSFTVVNITDEIILISKKNGSLLPMPRSIIDETVRLVEEDGLIIESATSEALRELGSNLEAAFITGYKGLHDPMAQMIIQRKSETKWNEDNYVLVIDEINRGNISKVFGELITLIEPSKRAGKEEALDLTLPFSGKRFSVPSNLHIIGTMNTADRSLAMMDTALRRRFDFVEMMPKSELFKHHQIEYQEQQIDLKCLLEVLNKRIEVLYDREHTLGHAFLFPAYNAAKVGKHELAFTYLKEAFKNKIIPLLEEYFYEDWNKIRLVLGDSLKIGANESLRLLEVQKESYTDLFGGEHGLDLYEDCKMTYQMKPFDCKDSIWDKAEAYIGIYSPKRVKGEVVEG